MLEHWLELGALQFAVHPQEQTWYGAQTPSGRRCCLICWRKGRHYIEGGWLCLKSTCPNDLETSKGRPFENLHENTPRRFGSPQIDSFQMLPSPGSDPICWRPCGPPRKWRQTMDTTSRRIHSSAQNPRHMAKRCVSSSDLAGRFCQLLPSMERPGSMWMIW